VKVLDLFSGIGGFSLGLERAGFETVAFAEIDQFCSEVLKLRWPNVENLGDVRGISLSGLIRCGLKEWSGGDKEQPHVRPDWLIVENVAHTWRSWVPELRRELWSIGYASLPLRVSAAELGSPHNRKRVYVVAHANGELLREFAWWWQWEGRKMAAIVGQHWHQEPGIPRVDDGISDRAQRNKAIGNSVIPQIPEIIGRAILEQTS
jgi:DNA (cytosine-5)-methyltransferase 1